MRAEISSIILLPPVRIIYYLNRGERDHHTHQLRQKRKIFLAHGNGFKFVRTHPDNDHNIDKQHRGRDIFTSIQRLAEPGS